MICPMMSKQVRVPEVRDLNQPNIVLEYSRDEFFPAECQQGDCAWWIVGERMCAATRIALSLTSIDKYGPGPYHPGS